MTPNKEEYFTLSELHKSGLIWWLKSVQTLRKWVEADIEHENILKVIVVGDGIKKRYYFKKENVEEYIKSFQKREVRT